MYFCLSFTKKKIKFQFCKNKKFLMEKIKQQEKKWMKEYKEIINFFYGFYSTQKVAIVNQEHELK